MKIIKEIPEKNIIKVMPENLDDLWHLYNIIEKNSAVSAMTERRVEDKGDKLRADRGAKKRVYLGIKAEKINFHEDTNRLRVSGKIIYGPDDIPLGSYHTIDIEPYTEVSIQKNWKRWDLERLKDAENSAKKPKVVIVIMDELEANIYLVREYGAKEVAHIKSSLSKRLNYKQQEQEKLSYYNEIANAISQYEGKILVAGPGFGKNNFQKYLSEKYNDIYQRTIFESTNHTGRLGLNEVLKSGIIDRIYGEARLSKETQLVNKLLEEISKRGLAVYGFDDVKNALNYSAIETLLITDEFLRKNRKKMENIVNSVENIGGKTVIISTEHDAGKQLKGLGGIGAILRFPIE
ncbi:mRNA surveillance protein pelota [Methanothermococcus okinawensis]|uniref:Protein pelota homolog n=1 Tax=Methanothermococcus okinawensis (strain DSM 14208 / JCM 11175 / IH1) TaxID=647113 RepID=F8AND0_METOI|nr:mRNA surveillance protein pelota [Methanothermococcus okinawensis]AEH06189.1 Pelota-like protein [Methanothermococcus okinawensis IH1]